jgi:hypothetical protein
MIAHYKIDSSFKEKNTTSNGCASVSHINASTQHYLSPLAHTTRAMAVWSLQSCREFGSNRPLLFHWIAHSNITRSHTAASQNHTIDSNDLHQSEDGTNPSTHVRYYIVLISVNPESNLRNLAIFFYHSSPFHARETNSQRENLFLSGTN